jgi:drug/metabolite transporter (DMT)-like permease
MTPVSLMLLLIAAFLHATVNVFMKAARDKLAFIWWVLGVSSVLGAPLLLFTALPHDAQGWGLVVASGFLESIYFVALSRAYSYGDLSQVYPIARGSAPLFILAWAGMFLRERPSAAGVCGVLTIVSGLYLINLPSLRDWKRPLSGFKDRALWWSLVTGVLISAYATVDKVGVKYVEPRAYVVLILAVAWAVLALQWFDAGRRRAVLDEIRRDEKSTARRACLYVVLGALFGTVAYLLVLLALQLSPVGYIGAVREFSVVIGAWMGVRFLNERRGTVRIAASALIVVGILLITFAG